jgi:ATP-dependent Clp protease ATP-binding subunit ClpC
MDQDLRCIIGDLRQIFAKTFKKAKNNKLRMIPLSMLLFEFFDYYINTDKGRDSEIKSHVRNMTLDDKENLLSDLNDAVQRYDPESDTKEIGKSINYDKNIPLSYPIKAVISELCEENPIITSSDFLNALFENDETKDLPVVKTVMKYYFPNASSPMTSSKGDDIADKKLDDFKKFLEKFGNGGISVSGGILGDDSIFKSLFGEAFKKNMFGDAMNEAMKNLGINTEKLPEASDTPEGGGDSPEDFEMYGKSEGISAKPFSTVSKTPRLDAFSFNMTDAAERGSYDPVVGRDDIIDSMIEDMCKRKKNNIILLGDAGVGKSAIVECLAQRIASGNVPEQLKKKRIYSLNLNDLVAGTKYRGEYEERLQGIIKEVISDPDIIIFIDEFHNLVGNGGEKGNGDGANILKPYLARGQFKCIGATTLDEYRKFIEKDAALKRRFTEIIVSEPTEDETFKILKAINSKYEDFHKVRCSADVLKRCVEWSGRYITDRFFPDKAIDVLDKASAYVKISTVKDTKRQEELLEKIDSIIDQKVNAVFDQRDFAKGEELRKQELELTAELEKEIKSQELNEKKKKNWPSITESDVAKAVSKISKVPIDKIQATDNEMILEMKQRLEKRVIGQDPAIDTIIKSIQRNYLGLRDPKKPILSALFVGPSGVGKTLICKEVAEIFFGSQKALIKIDMNNFKTEMDVTRLIGASAGYVGYEDEPLLMKVKRQPRSVILLDEIEKAHTSIYDIFMDILDEGVCTLANGTKVDFTNTIIIFTGNIGTKDIKASGNGLGFESSSADRNARNKGIVKKAIDKTFRPEFINRISSIVIFNELGDAELGKIFAIELQDIKKKLGKNKYTIQVGKSVRDYVISLCDPVYGARDLKRNIEKYVVDPISNSMLEDPGKTKFSVEINENKEAEVK